MKHVWFSSFLFVNNSQAKKRGLKSILCIVNFISTWKELAKKQVANASSKITGSRGRQQSVSGKLKCPNLRYIFYLSHIVCIFRYLLFCPHVVPQFALPRTYYFPSWVMQREWAYELSNTSHKDHQQRYGNCGSVTK